MEDYSLPPGSLFLGFDCSTQSLKATVLDQTLKIFATEVVIFDNELPHYKTEGGVYRDPLVDGRIVSPPLMWVEALDLILSKLEKSSFDFGRVLAVSGSAQQHGSVYWKNGISMLLSSLDPWKPLKAQLGDAFSTNESPIWMDCSTTEQCRAIEEAIGGALELSKLTGSCAHERYAGPQIRKMFETRRKVYEDTERISLISSFMASLLIGGYACIDHTDGAGMNLMDIKLKSWSKIALEATAPDLETKLGDLAPAHAVAGFVSNYFVQRYRFKKNCVVVQWSGDNPNSLAGLALSTPGDLAISLGTSDTVSREKVSNVIVLFPFLERNHEICPVFGVATEHNPSLDGHTFPNPVNTEDYMVMLVYKNGSLTREGTELVCIERKIPDLLLRSVDDSLIDIRNRYAGRSWELFDTYMQRTPPLNGGKIGFYYKEHEILPPLPIGEHRYVLEDVNLSGREGIEVAAFDAASEVRALIEGQLLSMRSHAEKIGMPSPPRRIIATGGASANDCILTTMASIFGCNVYTVQRPDSASLGAALRAAHGFLCNENGAFVPIKSMYTDRLEHTSLNCKLSAMAADEELIDKYTLMMKKRAEIENKLVRKLGRS